MSDHTIRIDKFLWHARLVKTRSLAQRLCAAGLVEIIAPSGEASPIARAAQNVKPGDRLRIHHGGWMRTVVIRAPGLRRGPAIEARELYTEIALDRGKPEDDVWETMFGDDTADRW